MTAKNDITGDSIKSRHLTNAYSDGWDRIFGKKQETKAEPTVEPNEGKSQNADDTETE